MSLVTRHYLWWPLYMGLAVLDWATDIGNRLQVWHNEWKVDLKTAKAHDNLRKP